MLGVDPKALVCWRFGGWALVGARRIALPVAVERGDRIQLGAQSIVGSRVEGRLVVARAQLGAPVGCQAGHPRAHVARVLHHAPRGQGTDVPVARTGQQTQVFPQVGIDFQPPAHRAFGTGESSGRAQA